MISVFLTGGLNESFIPFSLYNCKYLSSLGNSTILDKVVDNLDLRSQSSSIYIVSSQRYAADIESHNLDGYNVFIDEGNLGSGGALRNFIQKSNIKEDKVLVFRDTLYVSKMDHRFDQDDPITVYKTNYSNILAYLLSTDMINRYSPDDKIFSLDQIIKIATNFEEINNISVPTDKLINIDSPKSFDELRKDANR